MRRNLRRCRAVMDARKFTTCSPCIIRETVNSNFTPWMVKLYPVFAVRDMFGGNGGGILWGKSRNVVLVFFEDGNLERVSVNVLVFSEITKVLHVCVTSAFEFRSRFHSLVTWPASSWTYVNPVYRCTRTANPWPRKGKEISGIKSSFSVSIHRSSVMNRYDSVAGSIVDALFARVSRRNRRRGRGDVSKANRKIFMSYTRRTREGILF